MSGEKGLDWSPYQAGVQTIKWPPTSDFQMSEGFQTTLTRIDGRGKYTRCARKGCTKKVWDDDERFCIEHDKEEALKLFDKNPALLRAITVLIEEWMSLYEDNG